MLLAHHYRTDWFWTEDDLTAAQERLDVWRGAITRGTAAEAAPVIDAIRAALAEDLDTAKALAAVDAWAESNGDDPSAAADVAIAVDALLGVRL